MPRRGCDVFGDVGKIGIRSLLQGDVQRLQSARCLAQQVSIYLDKGVEGEDSTDDAGYFKRQLPPGGRRSIRLVITPCTVSGKSRLCRSPSPGFSTHSPSTTWICPVSRKAYAISPLKNGLPCALSTINVATCSGRTCTLAAGRSGSEFPPMPSNPTPSCGFRAPCPAVRIGWAQEPTVDVWQPPAAAARR